MLYILTILTLWLESKGLLCISGGSLCCTRSWNKIQNKSDDGCQPGYFGKTCEQKCHFPRYGYLCQQQCNCPEISCHHKDGCRKQSNLKAKEWLHFRRRKYAEKCNPGFSGKNCSIPCRYPGFGQLCQEVCDCSKDICDPVQGCKQKKVQGCISGYIGKDCSDICPYPTYGMECKQLCQCDERYCDIETGCSSEYGCRPGYFGFRCVYKCRYPNYGKFCQKRCTCSKVQCDHVVGCAEKRGKKNFFGLNVTRSEKTEKTTSVEAGITSVLLVILFILGAVIWFQRLKIQKWCNKKSDNISIRNETVSTRQTISCIESANLEMERESCRYFSFLHVNRQNPKTEATNTQCQLDVSNLYETVEYPAPNAYETYSDTYPKLNFISTYSGDDNEILIPI